MVERWGFVLVEGKGNGWADLLELRWVDLRVAILAEMKGSYEAELMVGMKGLEMVVMLACGKVVLLDEYWGRRLAGSLERKWAGLKVDKMEILRADWMVCFLVGELVDLWEDDAVVLKEIAKVGDLAASTGNREAALTEQEGDKNWAVSKEYETVERMVELKDSRMVVL